MTLIIISSLSMITVMFLLTKHPLSMGLMLMMQTIFVSMLTGMMINNFWYSFILFMVMIGGMLVLFLYMTSIASNKKFKFSWKMLMLMMISLLIPMFPPFSSIFLNLSMMEKSIMLEMSMKKFFIMPTMLLMIVLINYLLLTLIAVVKITKTNFGPLRQK